MAAEGEQDGGTREVTVTLTEDGRVYMLDRTGSPVTVAKDEVPRALQAGYTLETQNDVVQRRDREEQQAKEGAEHEQYMTLGAIVLGGLLLFGLFKLLKVLRFKGALVAAAVILIGVAFVGSFGFFWQLLAGGLVLIAISAMVPRKVVVEHRYRYESEDEEGEEEEEPRPRKKKRKRKRPRTTEE